MLKHFRTSINPRKPWFLILSFWLSLGCVLETICHPNSLLGLHLNMWLGPNNDDSLCYCRILGLRIMKNRQRGPCTFHREVLFVSESSRWRHLHISFLNRESFPNRKAVLFFMSSSYIWAKLKVRHEQLTMLGYILIM